MNEILGILLAVILLPLALAIFVFGIDQLIVNIESVKWRLRRLMERKA